MALEKIQRAGLTINNRCQFSKDRIKFLGQIIDGLGVHPDKVSAITNVGTPGNVSNVWHFWGVFNQLSKFIPNLADETKP